MVRGDAWDVIVIGGGHAGVEAALASARLGAATTLLTSNLDTIAQMSCNPAIGGVAKGQIVREVDALGGAMGRAIDAAGIQFRMLNRSKGPAMHGPRAQADKRAYQQAIRQILDDQPGLALQQATVEDLLVEGTPARPRVIGVRTADGQVLRARAVVVCAGTFMRGLLHVGDASFPGGRIDEPASNGLSAALERLGFRVERFKTGTPPRLDGRTIDYHRTELQPGDARPEPFSFVTDGLIVDQLPCYITHTNPQVHEILRANLDRAPMYSGQITSVGPRYCPSLETKVVRFAQRDRHQLYLEPEGRQTHDVYVNGLSTSLPRDVQDALVRAVAGLERATIVRYGYAIEYDYLPPDQLYDTLQTKRVAGLYAAGQTNGTTGYEEAAGQGLLAGANAALELAGRPPLVLRRDEAYLGVMVDDLVTKGVDEPYRMFTSRAEYRLLLRADNADRRLTPIGRRLGLVDAGRAHRLDAKLAAMARANALLAEARIDGVPAAALLRRPETQWEDVVGHLPELAATPPAAATQVLYDAKYAGYIGRQEAAVARQQRLAARRIPRSTDYTQVAHLRAEAREKLARFAPADLAQASRISGITPADLAVLAAHLGSSAAGGGSAARD